MTRSTATQLLQRYLQNINKIHRLAHKGVSRELRHASRVAIHDALKKCVLKDPRFKSLRQFYQLSGVVSGIGDLAGSRSRVKMMKRLSTILYALCEMQSSHVKTLIPDDLEFVQKKTAHLCGVVAAEKQAVNTLVSISCPGKC
jgi:hypothetical protein